MITAALIDQLEGLPGEVDEYDVWIYLPPDSEHGTPVPIIARGDRVTRLSDDSSLSSAIVAREETGAIQIVPEQRITRIMILERE